MGWHFSVLSIYRHYAIFEQTKTTASFLLYILREHGNSPSIPTTYMIFSRASEYAIQAMLYLAKREMMDGKKLIQTREIAESHTIPYHFLAKIVQDLAKADLIVSLKGPSGGIGLAHDSKEISVLEIVRSVDNIQYVTDCVVGYEKCSSESPCPLHYEWEKIRNVIFNLIREKTLRELVENTEFANGRLLVSSPQTTEGTPSVSELLSAPLTKKLKKV